MAAPPGRAAAVVVGGGVIGTSVAYHLARCGWRDIILLEQAQMTAGTTWMAAGVVGLSRTSAAHTRICVASGPIYERLSTETGVRTGYMRCGGLTVARTPERLAWLHRQAARLGSLKVEARMLSPVEATTLVNGMLRTDGFLGALHVPGEGVIRSSDLTLAFARGAEANDAVRIFEGVRVVGLKTSAARLSASRSAVSGVLLESGATIETEVVVNCAGIWARSLFANVDAYVPLHPCEHFYAITGPVKTPHHHVPIIRDPDAGVAVRQSEDGFIIQCFERTATPAFLEGVPKTFAFSLLKEDEQREREYTDRFVDIYPAFSSVPMRHMVNGVESFTPDGKPIIGRDPHIRGLYVAAGFNATGVASAGGAGAALADCIVTDRTPAYLSEFAPSRFAAFHANPRFLRERVVETLGQHYAIQFPQAQMKTARNVRISPLHDVFLAQGMIYGHRHGHEIPLVRDPARTLGDYDSARWFPAIRSELALAAESMCLFDLSSTTKLLIGGRDAGVAIGRLSSLAFAGLGGGHGRTRIFFFPIVGRAGAIHMIAHAFRLTPAVQGSDDAWMLIVHGGEGSAAALEHVQRRLDAGT